MRKFLRALLTACAFSEDRNYFSFVQIHAVDAVLASAAKELHWTELNSAALASMRSASIELDRIPTTRQRIDCEQRVPAHADFLLIEIGLKQMH